MEEYEYPRPRPPEEPTLAEMLRSRPLTAAELLTCPLDVIREPGVYGAPDEFDAGIDRLIAIASAIRGPSRVPIDEGAAALLAIVRALIEDGAP